MVTPRSTAQRTCFKAKRTLGRNSHLQRECILRWTGPTYTSTSRMLLTASNGMTAFGLKTAALAILNPIGSYPKQRPEDTRKNQREPFNATYPMLGAFMDPAKPPIMFLGLVLRSESSSRPNSRLL